MKNSLTSLVWLLTIPSAFGADRGLNSLTADSFEALHALIGPRSEELKWKQIQWLTSLWEARQRAALQGKPIVLWEMDGNPLGCT